MVMKIEIMETILEDMTGIEITLGEIRLVTEEIIMVEGMGTKG